ncbi:xin actin-binding repeat-containing protein 1 [Hyaena hyaena]|uniref:xin actin-binding repeat-containing protein 1 n=1 Tax=Hyaena hyaena TaxID=95912 RepID=UPI0019229F89|nr:xin actin-binding repeat-containing protein 1 [Hyaena hyaena]
MVKAQTQAAPAPATPLAAAEDGPLPPAPAPEALPPPPPREAFSKSQQQRQASELRRLYRHIHPELRRNLAEAVAEDLAEVLDSGEPTEGEVQCMRWIFENWRLDAIGDRERPPAREPVPGGDVQATSRKFEEGAFANSTDQEPAGAPPPGGDVRAARQLFETKPLHELSGRAEALEATAREPEASGDVRGTRMLFETRPLDRLGSRPSIQEQSPLELRSEIQELKGDVKKTVKLFQTEPLCAIQDAEGAIHEVKAACREEIQSNAVRSARWLFETKPLDAINRDPSQVRVIRGISLEEGARPDVSATRWIFETQPLDAIREILVDEKDFQPSPDLIPPGPDVQHQKHLFETRALDTLKGEEESGAEPPAKEEVVPGDVRSTLWLFETKSLDGPRDKVQVGHLQRVGPREPEALTSEHRSGDGSAALPPAQSAPQTGGVKGDVKAFKNLFETLPLDSIGQGVPSAQRNMSRAEQPQDTGSPVYAVQDGQGHLHALTSVSREQVVGGDVQGYRWMFETQPLDQLGRSPTTVDVVRGITRQEVVAGDVGTARWLFETQPLELIHQREQQECQEEEGESRAGPQPEALPRGDVRTTRWLFETCPMSELAQRQAPEATDPTAPAEARSCTWMFAPQPPDGPEGAREQRLQASRVQAGDTQTHGHVFETEPLQASGRPCGRGPVRYCSRVEIPSGQVSRQREVFQALEAGKREDGASRALPEPVPVGSVRKVTWLFENCPVGSLAAESIRGDSFPEEQPGGPAGSEVPERQETAAEGTLKALHATPGVLLGGGVLMEARGRGELCLAKYVLPGPGQGGPRVRKEELVSGELPRIVRQVLRRPDVDQRGLLVQEDLAGQLHLKPLRLPGSGNVEDTDPEFQQLLACGLGSSVARTGLVMQETEQGLLSLTAYALQPRLASRLPGRGSVQMLASCIDKGDLSGLHSLRWEPPADPGPVPGGEGAQTLPLTENVIHVPPLDPGMGMGPPRAPGKAGPPAAEGKQEGGRAGQSGLAALGEAEGATATPLGPGASDLRAAVQNLRVATAEAQSPHQQVVNKHKPASGPGATPAPCRDGQRQAPAAATLAAPSGRPAAGGGPRTSAAPRKVSGEQEAPPTGLPGGRGTAQDGIHTAHPVRTSDPSGGVQPSEGGPPRSAQAPRPPQDGPSQSRGPGWEEPGGRPPMARGPPAKATARVGPGGLQAAETTLKVASLAQPALASGPRPAGGGPHSHNASVPPPLLPAAVTGPDSPAPGRREEESTQQDSGALRGPLLHPHGSPAGQRAPGDSRTRTPEPEPRTSPRTKPQLPPKPAHLGQMPPPQGLPKLSAPSPSASKAAGQGVCKREAGEAAHAPSAASQAGLPVAGRPSGQSRPRPQHGPGALASGSTRSQAAGSDAQSPEPPKPSALSGHPAWPQQAPSPPGEASESAEAARRGRQELLGLRSRLQALEKDAAGGVDVRAPRRLPETVPQLARAPAAPQKPEASVVQAFGELTKVSTEVARLREQTLARLRDIEEAVHKALDSMTSLQPETDTGGRSQGPPKDHSACKSSNSDGRKAGPDCSGREAPGQTAVMDEPRDACLPEAQSQAKVRNHTEAGGQSASAVPSTRRPETVRGDSGLPGAFPCSRESSCPPTFISAESATRRLPEAPSLDASVRSTHLAPDAGQARLPQKGFQDRVGQTEVPPCSRQPEPTPASLGSPLPAGWKSILGPRTGPGGPQGCGATGMATQQHEGVGQCRDPALPSSARVAGQAELSRDPGPQRELPMPPLLRPFLRSPAGLSGGLAEAGRGRAPCGCSQPEAQ